MVPLMTAMALRMTPIVPWATWFMPSPISRTSCALA